MPGSFRSSLVVAAALALAACNGKTRLRPILMATIATVVDLIPTAFRIGCLTVSVFFALFLIPALYTVLERFAKRTADEVDEFLASEAAHA